MKRVIVNLQQRISLLPLPLLLFSSHAHASDPRPLYWFVLITFSALGVVLFAIAAIIIVRKVKNSSWRSALIGLAFGFTLAPVAAPDHDIMPNLLTYALGFSASTLQQTVLYALAYAAASYLLHGTYRNIKRRTQTDA